MLSQISDLELRAENPLHFCGLMRIARCEEKLNHDSNGSGKQESDSKF
jgi:hypothetical protein